MIWVVRVGIWLDIRHLVGRYESWAKWSYARPPVTLWLTALSLEPEGWIEVGKTRRLLQFSLDAGMPEQVEPESQISEGCTIELTRIRARSCR